MNPLHEKICIYGGTFNPIHIGHLLTARAAIEACNLDRLILMPSGNSYKKEQQTILNSSKEFNFKDDSILKLKQYYGNKEIYLDLSKIDINMFEDLYYDPEKELDDMEDYDL